ncbi:CMT1A duplicated region transcript 1 protein [Dictyocoela muelleri]|nr:CMT1A duplicated region transcript 1 protein [Dictyocoela muelleri]
MFNQIFNSKIFNNAICIKQRKPQIITSYNTTLHFIELNPIMHKQLDLKKYIKKLFCINNQIYFTTNENEIYIIRHNDELKNKEQPEIELILRAKHEILDIQQKGSSLIIITKNNLIINKKWINIKESILKMIINKYICLLTERSIIVYSDEGDILTQIENKNINIFDNQTLNDSNINDNFLKGIFFPYLKNNPFLKDLLITNKEIKKIIIFMNQIYFIKNDLFISPKNETIKNINDAFVFENNIILVTHDYQILIFNDVKDTKYNKETNKNDNYKDNCKNDDFNNNYISKNISFRIFGDNKIVGKILKYDSENLILSTSYGIVKHKINDYKNIKKFDFNNEIFTGITLNENDFIFDVSKNLIAMGGSDEVLRIRDINFINLNIELKENKGIITSIQIDDKFVISGDNEGYIVIWKNNFINEVNNININTPILLKQIHKKTINSILIFNRSLITASRDKLIKITEILSGNEKGVLKHKRGIFSISRIGNTLVSSCGDGIYVWDLKKNLLKNFFEERSVLSCQLRYGKDISEYVNQNYKENDNNDKKTYKDSFNNNDKYMEELILVSGSYEGDFKIRTINGKQLYSINLSNQFNDNEDDFLSINHISIIDKKIYLGTDRILIVNRKMKENKIKATLFNYKEILESKGDDLVKLVDGIDNLYKKMLFYKRFFKEFLD